MNQAQIYQQIKATVYGYLPNSKVLLFGSRARLDFNPNSDYDILVVTPNAIAPKEKMNLESAISKQLVYLIKAPFDVLLHSQKEIDLKKNSNGFIVFHALKDAIEL